MLKKRGECHLLLDPNFNLCIHMHLLYKISAEFIVTMFIYTLLLKKLKDIFIHLRKNATCTPSYFHKTKHLLSYS